MSSMEVDGAPEIDEALYSRQLYVLGKESMSKLATASVLVVGASGVGVEIAKDIILSGVKEVTILDNSLVTHTDLASNPFVTEEMVGKNKAHACVSQLAELNHYVNVSARTGPLENELLAQQTIVVVTNTPSADLVPINNFCRENGVKFIAAESRGVFGYVFVDFGDQFEVCEGTDLPVAAGVISSVTQEENGTVCVPEGKRHDLSDGDVVTFLNVEGMEELNGKEFKVTVTDSTAFQIGDTRDFHQYTSGGYFQQIKQGQSFQFSSLEKCLKEPPVVYVSGCALNPFAQHLAFRALHAFQASHSGLLPDPTSSEEMEDMLVAARAVAAEEDATKQLDEEEEKAVRLLARVACGQLSPMCAAIGGLVAQEVLKGASHKYSPLEQFLYLEAVDALPEEVLRPSVVFAETMQCPLVQVVGETSSPAREVNRYEGQQVVFGKELQDTISNLRYFLVGAGALGCEFLKMFAMMGLGCGPQGQITVTDLDNIETSNLSRQFLFRAHHVKMSKSVVAAQAAREMNPNMNIVHMTDPVGRTTERIFNEDFWDSLDGVTNALDNVEARRYVDEKCIEFKLPLLESGTSGTQCNSQVIMPHLTESYSSSADPPEASIPLCTLKNYPYAIEHTIQWARDLFEGEFVNAGERINSYADKPDFIESLQDQPSILDATIEGLHDSLVENRPQSFEDCIVWARHLFQKLFYNTPAQLIHVFPPDHVTNEGQPFWGGNKRAPRPLEFNPQDPEHLNFIIATANLRAFVFNLSGSRDAQSIRDFVSTVSVPPFVPDSEKKIASTDEEEKTLSSRVDLDRVKKLAKELPPPSSLGSFRASVAAFEKDDDTNFHIDFVTAASNLRARNYRIPEADRSETRRIAGKIIPAMITTTALITGLVGLEMYKVIQKKPLDAYKNSFLNTSFNYITMSTPLAPPSGKYNETTWNLWDTLDVDEGAELTLQQFLNFIKDKYGVDIQMLSYGQSLLYTFFMQKKMQEERLKMLMSDVVSSATKKEVPDVKYLRFDCVAYDLDGEDVEVPSIRYRRKW